MKVIFYSRSLEHGLEFVTYYTCIEKRGKQQGIKSNRSCSVNKKLKKSHLLMNCHPSLRDVSKPRHWYYHCSLRVKITRPWCWPSLTRSDFSRADWSKSVVDKSTMEMTWWCCTSLYWDHSPKDRGSTWVLNIFHSFLWWIRVKTTETCCRFLFNTPAKISEKTGKETFDFVFKLNQK